MMILTSVKKPVVLMSLQTIINNDFVKLVKI